MDFEERYKQLNTSQQKAVDTIDGPVMVIAGPGTGKTELLSMRVANILRKTDVNPENILCLTYTESGVKAMRKRLETIIGRDSFRVPIHTFHSFGTEIIGQHSEYFHKGAEFSPAEEVTRHEILEEIFSLLAPSNPISGSFNGESTYLRDTEKIISELRENAMTADDLQILINENETILDRIEPQLTVAFSAEMPRKKDEKIALALKLARLSTETTGLTISLLDIPPIDEVLLGELSDAAEEAVATASTKTITKWRSKHMEKNRRGEWKLKARKHHKKLRAVANVYKQYIDELSKRKLFDFDDMILNVVAALENNLDLKLNLQEKYLYIMVDEFQDTNLAQMQILKLLTDNPVSDGNPDICVVGDDDQAIYSFQGARMSNILQWKNDFPTSKLIVLTENYRSHQTILDSSREVITQSDDRLENTVEELNKNLSANGGGTTSSITLLNFSDIGSEYSFVANEVKRLIGNGTKPEEIAIISRRHSSLELLAPYLTHLGIGINYERSGDALKQDAVTYIELFARVALSIATGRHADTNSLLPQLLAHPSFQIDPLKLWEISLKSDKNNQLWLETLLHDDSLQELAQEIITIGEQAIHSPLEETIDRIIQFYHLDIDDDPEKYLILIESMRQLRTHVMEYKPSETPNLETLVHYLGARKLIGKPMNVKLPGSDTEEGLVNLKTAHGSKGLEFEKVFIIEATDAVWGMSVKPRSRNIGYPENLTIKQAGDSYNERLRLFYVAMTRAKQDLTITMSTLAESGKEQLHAAFLNSERIVKQQTENSLTAKITAAKTQWFQPITTISTVDKDKLLRHRVENYRLSYSNLKSYLSVEYGGPQTFLLEKFFRIPTAGSPASAYGNAIHETIKTMHIEFTKDRVLSPEKLQKEFENNLKKEFRGISDYEKYRQHGEHALQNLQTLAHDLFTRNSKAEISFNSQLGDTLLTGKIDLLLIDEAKKTITIVDYKTGKLSEQKIKDYSRQLLFYRLLVEHAPGWQGYHVTSGELVFVDETVEGKAERVKVPLQNERAIEHLKKLIHATYQKIINLDFPDTTNFKNSSEFERYLLDNQ